MANDLSKLLMAHMGVDGTNGDQLSNEETAELHQLEHELEIWKHNKQLDKFKKLPSNLRQEIVDEALLRDLVTDYNHNNINEAEFENFDRLHELRSKCNPWHNIRIDAHHHDLHRPFHWKYELIFKQFTTDELIRAHTEVTLEEELSD